MTEKIKVIIKEPGEPVGRIEEIRNELKAFQKVVGGYIETITIADVDEGENGKGNTLDDIAEKMEEGMQALLRESIMNSYRYYKAKGYCEPEERIALAKTYNAYHDLGGNDIATDLYNRVLKLPTEDTRERGYVEEEQKSNG